MHTTQEWAQSSQYNMHQAQAAHRKALDQQDRSSRVHEGVMADNLSMRRECTKTHSYILFWMLPHLCAFGMASLIMNTLNYHLQASAAMNPEES